IDSSVFSGASMTCSREKPSTCANSSEASRRACARPASSRTLDAYASTSLSRRDCGSFGLGKGLLDIGSVMLDDHGIALEGYFQVVRIFPAHPFRILGGARKPVGAPQLTHFIKIGVSVLVDERIGLCAGRKLARGIGNERRIAIKHHACFFCGDGL